MPPLRELEAYVFEQLLRQLWRGVLIEATLGDSVAGAAAARPFPASHRRHATREETAVLRWLQALQVRTYSTSCLDVRDARRGTRVKSHGDHMASGREERAETPTMLCGQRTLQARMAWPLAFFFLQIQLPWALESAGIGSHTVALV